ncbi:MAG: PhnD/SsuA/transferrin family substrate-binding protein [Acidimicrobiia bacterium]|nr:PhnD/SsuA/transferrin family substrate-binding protein [Acidimicrobiia bacterium]
MSGIRLTSHMAAAADPLMHWLVEELDLTWVDGEWPDRLLSMSTGEVEVGWVCGLLHASRLARSDWPFAAIAAPVMISERHGDRPQYFGDVVVSNGSEAQALEDLAGTVFAYNETTSLSGYHMLLNRLGSLDQFERAVESGSHADSLTMVRSGLADVAVIDSTVMDMTVRCGSTDVGGIRTIESLGPYPMPPIVGSTTTDPRQLAEIHDRLVTLHTNEQSRRAMASWGVARFEAVTDEVYLTLASG